jgi:hypothetical protein
LGHDSALLKNFSPREAAGEWPRRSPSRRRQCEYLAPATYTLESNERKVGGITSARCSLDLD